MQKSFLLIRCVVLTILTCAALAGCQSENKQALSNLETATVVSSPVMHIPTTPATEALVSVIAIRVKAGSASPFTDSSGHVWLADQGFDGGDTVQRADTAIANTKDPGLYQAEHYSMNSFSCKTANGKYLAKLHFAETFEGITGAGQRVFSMNVQGHEFKDFDVFAKAGGANRAYIEVVPVEITDGQFKITFTSNIENPQINAIEIVPRP